MGPLTPIIGIRLLALAAGLRHNAEIGQPGLCFSAYSHKFGINHLAAAATERHERLALRAPVVDAGPEHRASVDALVPEGARRDRCPGARLADRDDRVAVQLPRARPRLPVWQVPALGD